MIRRVENQRKRFEAWIRAYYVSPFRMDRLGGRYIDLTVQSHWECWIAAALSK